MMRAFLAKRNVTSKLKAFRQESGKILIWNNTRSWGVTIVCFVLLVQKEEKSGHHLTDAEAAIAIQKGTD